MPTLVFFYFDLYHITTFKVEINSNRLYKKGAKFRVDNCFLDKCRNYSCHAVRVDSSILKQLLKTLKYSQGFGHII